MFVPILVVELSAGLLLGLHNDSHIKLGQRGAKSSSPRARKGITTAARLALVARLPDC